MTEKLSPKMQKLVDELASGEKIVVEIYGKFEAFTVDADGTTRNGRRVDPTAKALISRGILVRGVAKSETLVYWVLADAPAVETPDMDEVDAILAEGIPTANGGLLLPAIQSTEITVESGDKVTRDGVKGKVLEVCTRAGVMLAAVAFGFDLVWVKVAELVAL